MAWQIQWGLEIPALLEFRDSSGITPRALENRPVLDNRLSFFYGEFQELHRGRTYSGTTGSPRPLALCDFVDYCEFNNVSRNDQIWMWDVIKLFDQAWLEEFTKKQKLEQDSATTNKT